jgi:iron complex outermembrane receptor protein
MNNTNIMKQNKMMGLLACLLFNSAAYSQNITIEEVVVTANKKQESLQEVGASITAFTSTSLENMGIMSAEEIALRTPNFSMSAFNIAQPRLFIRGIGSTDDGAAQDNSVAVFLDEVYIARGAAQLFELFDLERIEVLRGPQGTLYGKNVVGGVMNVLTKNPVNEKEYSVGLTAGDYGETNFKFMANNPMSDALSNRTTLISKNRDGFSRNILTNQEMDNKDYLGFRTKFLYEVEGITLTLSADSSEHEDGGQSRKGEPFGPWAFGSSVTAVLTSTNPRESESPRTTFQKQEISGVSAKLVMDTAYGTFTSITASRESDTNLLDAFTGVGSPPFLVLDTANAEIENAEQFSQEFRLDIDVNDQLDLMLGYYYLSEDVNRTETSDLESLIGSMVDALSSLRGKSGSYQIAENETTGIFINGTYNLSEKLSATLGIRRSTDEKTIRTSVVDIRSVGSKLAAPPTEVYDIRASEDWDATTPSFLLKYDFSPSVNLYGSVSKGYKSGGFQGQAPTGAAASTAFNPEFAWNYEFGLKSNLLENRLMLNISTFSTDYEDLQVRQNATKPGETIPILRITNAAEGEVEGLEIEWNAVFNERFSSWGSIAYLDSKYLNFIDNSGADVSGNALQFAPEQQINIGLRYENSYGQNTTFFSQIDYTWQDEYFTEPGNAPVHLIADYGLINARLGWVVGDGKWKVELWGKNLSDELYQMHIIPFLGDRFATYGPPKTMGASITLQW